MKKIILLLILFSSISAFSQDSLMVKPPRVFSKPKPIVEYLIVHDFKTYENSAYEVVTKLYILRQGQHFFEIFARWEGLIRQLKFRSELETYHTKLAEKELQIIGWHE